jgi:hypothetical protein
MRRLIGILPGTVAWLLPVFLLIVVAVNQLRLAHTEALSPWSGGGFGMFSTTDSPDNRHLHAVLQNQDMRKEVRIPRDLVTETRRATTLPSRGRLGALAAELALRESGDNTLWREIEMQVWAIDYDPDTLAPRGRLLRRERFDIASD